MALIYRDPYPPRYSMDECSCPVRRSRGYPGFQGIHDPMAPPYHMGEPFCHQCGDVSGSRRDHVSLPYDRLAPPRPRGHGARPMLARAQTDFGPRHYGGGGGGGGYGYEDVYDDSFMRPQRRRGYPRGYSAYARGRYSDCSPVWMG